GSTRSDSVRSAASPRANEKRGRLVADRAPCCQRLREELPARNRSPSSPCSGHGNPAPRGLRGVGPARAERDQNCPSSVEPLSAAVEASDSTVVVTASK